MNTENRSARRARHANRLRACVAARCGLIALLLGGCPGVAQPPPAAERQPPAATQPARGQPGRLDAAYWHSKPPLRATLQYPLAHRLSAQERDALRHLRQGQFRPSSLFDWEPLGVPPPWESLQSRGGTYQFYLHAMGWTVPLVRDWAENGHQRSLELALACWRAWAARYGQPTDAAPRAWSDHAVSYRTRVLCWMWELWRRSDAFDPETAGRLLEWMQRHGDWLADDRNYPPQSNHGLHMDASLIALAVTVPELPQAAAWRQHAIERVRRFVRGGFSRQGFYLEQAPFYHWYVLTNFGQLAVFLRANGQPVPEAVEQTLRRGLAAWPWLVRPDGRVPNIGDSGSAIPDDWPKRARSWLNADPPPPAADSSPNPRGDGSRMLVDPQAGYAIFRSGGAAPHDGFYAVFRCNATPYSNHCHDDALSFELFARGRDWFVDSGKYSYDARRSLRKYMVSPAAHSRVLIDGVDASFPPVRVLRSERTAEADLVVARIEYACCWHTRRFEVRPPATVVIEDTIEARDGQPRRVRQLWHTAPGLEVKIVTPQVAVLAAPDGTRCTVRQTNDAGQWQIVRGQTDPEPMGWYSRDFGEVVPIATLIYRTREPAKRIRLRTELHITPPEAHGLPPAPSPR